MIEALKNFKDGDRIKVKLNRWDNIGWSEKQLEWLNSNQGKELSGVLIIEDVEDEILPEDEGCYFLPDGFVVPLNFREVELVNHQA